MTKKGKKLQLRENFDFFLIAKLFLSLREGLQRSKRRLQPSRENIQFFKTSGSRSADSVESGSGPLWLGRDRIPAREILAARPNERDELDITEPGDV
jgi:hypothetical protein